LRRMRGLYRARRDALAAALVDVLGDRLHIELQAGGMHLVARLAPHEGDTALVARAHAHGLAPGPLSAAAIAPGCGPGLPPSFTNIAEAEAPLWAERLRRALYSSL